MIKRFLLSSLLLSGMISAKEHGNRSGEVVFDHSGERYAITGSDFVLVNGDGQEEALLNAYGAPVIAAAFSIDDQYLASVEGGVKKLKVYNLKDNTSVELALEGFVTDQIRVLFAAQENVLVVGCSIKLLVLQLNGDKLTQLAELKADNNVRAGFDLSGDLKQILFNGQRYAVVRGAKKWELKKPTDYPRITGKLNQNRMSLDGKRALFLHGDRKLISEINLETSEILKTINLTDLIGDMETNADLSKAFFSGGVLDVKRGKVSSALSGDARYVNCNESGDSLSVGTQLKKSDGKILDLKAQHVFLDDIHFQEKGEVLTLATESHKYLVNLEYKFVSAAPVDNLGRKKVMGMLGYSSNGHYGVDASGRVYDYRNRTYLRGALLGNTVKAKAVAISDSGVVAMLTNRDIYFYDLEKRETLGNFSLEESLTDATHSFMAIDKFGKNLLVNYEKSGKSKTLLIDVDLRQASPLMDKLGNVSAAVFLVNNDVLLATGKSLSTLYSHAGKSYIDEKSVWSIESGAIESLIYDTTTQKLAVRNVNGQVDVFDKNRKKLITLSQLLGKYELSTED